MTPINLASIIANLKAGNVTLVAFFASAAKVIAAANKAGMGEDIMSAVLDTTACVAAKGANVPGDLATLAAYAQIVTDFNSAKAVADAEPTVAPVIPTSTVAQQS